MSCPICGAQIISNARFCRACGAKLPPALEKISERLPGKDVTDLDTKKLADRSHIGGKQPALEKGIKEIIVGALFLTVAFITLGVSPGSGRVWWFWMMIFSAFYSLYTGIIKVVRFKYGEHSASSTSLPSADPPEPGVIQLQSYHASELVGPGSITEGTTRRLDSTTARSKENSEVKGKESGQPVLSDSIDKSSRLSSPVHARADV